jgi:hypothetical protein
MKIAAGAKRNSIEVSSGLADNAAVQKYLKTAFWTAMAFAVVMAILPNSNDLHGIVPDKIQHMAAFASLAILGTLAYPRIPRLLLALGLVVVGALIEVVQMIPALHRDAEWGDLFADSFAVALILVCMQFVLKALPNR